MDDINNDKIKVAIYSGSFNPPGIHHKKIVEKVLKNVDFLIVIPCGSKKRKDKKYPRDIFRKKMIKLGFSNIQRCYIDNINLNMDIFMSNYELEERYKRMFGTNVEFLHVVGSDLTCIYKDEKSRIECIWENGEELWRNSKFIVILREGYEIDHLPNNCMVMEDFIIDGSSTKIKKDIKTSEDILEKVREYILQNDIYDEGR